MFVVVFVALVSFLAALLIAPKAMRFLLGCGIVGIDQQKKGNPKLPSSGGLVVAFGMLAGLMVYIALNTFWLREEINLTLLLAASSTILIITLIGVLDDLHIKQSVVRNSKGTREYRVGLKQWAKAVLTIPAAVPLMAVSAGESIITLPFFGATDVGLIYPLILVPIAVVCVSNVNNMLAGMNGLEAGLGFVASLAVGLYALLWGRVEGCVIALLLAASLLAFLKYNWFPAKMLPGDSLTYLIGATFVTAVIVGNVEMFAIVVYIPWILEALLKLRAGFHASSLGVLQEDGTLKPTHKKIYSLTHIVMRTGRFREKQVTGILIAAEILVCLMAFLLFLPG